MRGAALLVLLLSTGLAPAADLEGRLRGTLVAGNRAAAIFADEGGRQRLFRVGEKVDGATIERIEPGRVLLREGGGSRWVLLPQVAVAAMGAPGTASGGAAGRLPRSVSEAIAPPPAREALEATGRNLGRAFMEQVVGVSVPEGGGLDPIERLAALAGSGALPEEGLYRAANAALRTVKIAPHEENGQPAGVRLDLVMPGSPAAGLGFVGGDVIVAVDGYPVRSLRDALRLYAVLGDRKEVTVDYLRGGRRESKVVRLR